MFRVFLLHEVPFELDVSHRTDSIVLLNDVEAFDQLFDEYDLEFVGHVYV